MGLKYGVIGCFGLIVAMIAVSIAVSFLTRQMYVDPITGITTTGDNEVMKTSQALFFYPADSIHNETLDRLADLETMILNDGTVSFNIKGFACKNEETILLVEGGT